MEREDSAGTRQPSEPPRAYHAFGHYRDLGSNRSADRAWRVHKSACEHATVRETARAPRNWATWSVQWGWVDRAARWDTSLDRQHRQKAAQAQHDARERHARLAQGSLTTLTAPIRAALDAMADPTVINGLVERVRSGPDGFLSVLGVIARAAGAIPALIAMERLALGMTTDRVEVDDRPLSTLANQIVSDPTATQLAIALLDQLAGSTKEGLRGPGSPFPSG